MTMATEADKPARAAAVFEGLLGILLDRLVEERAGRAAVLRQAFENVQHAHSPRVTEEDLAALQRETLDETQVLPETNESGLQAAFDLLDAVDQARTDAAALCQAMAPPTNDDRLRVRIALLSVEQLMRDARDKLLRVIRAIEENGNA